MRIWIGEIEQPAERRVDGHRLDAKLPETITQRANSLVRPRIEMTLGGAEFDGRYPGLVKGVEGVQDRPIGAAARCRGNLQPHVTIILISCRPLTRRSCSHGCP